MQCIYALIVLLHSLVDEVVVGHLAQVAVLADLRAATQACCSCLVAGKHT